MAVDKIDVCGGEAIATCEAVALQNVGVARGGRRILEGIDVHVPSGSALILRGANGTGKTTLLRAMAGLQPCAAGRITPEPDAMAYASHADGLKGTLSAAHNLRFWARLHNSNDIEPALSAFDLVPLRNRLAAALSAGQRRRLGLARMMVTGRPVWLFDEPTVSLDTAATARFAAVVEAHLGRGGIAVIATHIPLGLSSVRELDLGAFRVRPETSVGQPGTSDDDGFGGDAAEAFQ
ncbi:MAG: heme ABC exporter ATP-binding protein CcmA [Pseudomonadota bacterium]